MKAINVSAAVVGIVNNKGAGGPGRGATRNQTRGRQQKEIEQAYQQGQEAGYNQGQSHDQDLKAAVEQAYQQGREAGYSQWKNDGTQQGESLEQAWQQSQGRQYDPRRDSQGCEHCAKISAEVGQAVQIYHRKPGKEEMQAGGNVIVCPADGRMQRYMPSELRFLANQLQIPRYKAKLVEMEMPSAQEVDKEGTQVESVKEATRRWAAEAMELVQYCYQTIMEEKKRAWAAIEDKEAFIEKNPLEAGEIVWLYDAKIKSRLQEEKAIHKPWTQARGLSNVCLRVDWQFSG